MKYISLSLAAILCMGSPLLAETTDLAFEKKEVQQANFLDSKKFVEFVREQYIQGKYQEFLQKMNEDYNQTKKDGGLEGLIALRKENALIAASRPKTVDQWDRMTKTWTEERNKELLKLVGPSNQSILAEKIRAVSLSFDPSQEESLSYFSHLKSLVPGEGKNKDENLLIERDIELEYKLIHLNSLISQERWSPDYQEKCLVLYFEALDKILADSQKFQDKELKQKVATLDSLFDIFYIKQMDQLDLHRLASGAIVPTTDLEKKAIPILVAYEGKFSDLTREILQQTD